MSDRPTHQISQTSVSSTGRPLPWQHQLAEALHGTPLRVSADQGRQTLTSPVLPAPEALALWRANAMEAGVKARLEGVSALAGDGFITGASGRNWAAYGAEVSLAAGLPSQAQALLSDPQTSGGLLVSCSPESVDEVMTVFARHGFDAASVVGRVVPVSDRALLVA